MNILIVGGGGREHALVWKISQSTRVQKIYCAPGNAGIAALAECVAIDGEDVDALVDFAKSNAIDLTLVGPEGPLAAGLSDRFEAEGLRVFGASQKAARLESSKSFSKYIMEKYGIPTAAGRTFTDPDAARACVREMGAPIVVKADGLAAGKGVIVCESEEEALQAIDQIMVERVFGAAGDRLIVEERLVGEEASFLAFTDGKTVLPLPSSQDHKPVYDDDKGPNTGGMGAYSPAPIVDAHMHRKVMREVMIPTVKAMAAEGCPYKGDPEAQPLLMRLKNDIVPVLEAVVDGRLHECALEIDDRATVCVVMASGGYPGAYKKGLPISGLDDASRMSDVMVFHAGTAASDGAVAASGGRVLGVTALGDTVRDAISRAYDAVSKISWEGVHFRQDIGRKALKRLDAAPQVGIVMGSDSDLPIMEAAADLLKSFGVPFEMTVASAHRSPHRAAEFATSARDRGMKTIIAGAGYAAHLAGVLAAHTTLPVIGVPVDGSSLQGLDALLATVQMPPGVPVATVTIGKPGAKNAAILALQILALSDPALEERLAAYKAKMADEVEKKAKKVEQPI